jgi:hypothetical protein
MVGRLEGTCRDLSSGPPREKGDRVRPLAPLSGSGRVSLFSFLWGNFRGLALDLQAGHEVDWVRVEKGQWRMAPRRDPLEDGCDFFHVGSSSAILLPSEAVSSRSRPGEMWPS